MFLPFAENMEMEVGLGCWILSWIQHGVGGRQKDSSGLAF